MVRRLLVAACVALVAAPARAQDAPPKAKPPLGAKAKKYAAALIKIYHLRQYPELADKIEKAEKDLAGLDGHSWKGLSKALNDAFFPLRKPEEGKTWLGDDKENGIKIDGHPCFYYIKVPKGYSPSKATPLLVALHGGGEGAGDGSEAMGTMGSHLQDRCLVAAPTAPGLPSGAWAYPRGIRTTRAIIKEMDERYNIDHNRIYVGGHSMGGYGGYFHAVWWPDRFAGHTSAAGGITAGVVNDLEILYNTPLFVVHGVQDTKQAYWSYVECADRMIKKLPLKPQWYEFVGLPDAGHGFSSQYHKRACEWMFEHIRTPFPKKVVCTVPRVNNPEAIREMPGEEPGGRCFWVEILARSGRDFNTPAKVVAEFDAKTNTVTVTTPLIQRVKHPNQQPDHPDSTLIEMPNTVTRIGICLSDDMMDLDKPVTITCNGEQVFKGIVERKVDFLLDKLVETGDPASAFAAMVEFDAVGVPANPYAGGDGDD